MDAGHGLQDGVVRVKFQHPLGLRHGLVHGLHDALHVGVHAVLLGYQAAGAVGQAVGEAHLLDLVLQPVGNQRDQVGKLLLGLFPLLLLLLLLLFTVQADIAAVDRLERLLLVLGQGLYDPLIHRVGHEQYLKALGAEGLQMGRLLQGFTAHAGDEVDLLLPLRHPGDILLQRNEGARLGSRALEQHQILEFLLVGIIEMDALLDDLAKLLPEGDVFGEGLLLDLGQRRQDLADQPFLDALDLHVFLQDLAGDVQRQVAGIHHTFDKAQVVGNQLLALVGDEDAFDVQLQTLLAVGHEHVEGLLGRQIEQGLEFAGTLGREVDRAEGGLKVMGDMLVEFAVLLFGHLALGACPDGLHGVEDLLLGGLDLAGPLDLLAVHTFGHFTTGDVHHHRVLDVIGVLLDDGADLPLVQVALELVLQVQHDLGPALLAAAFLDRVGAVTGGFPEAPLLCRAPLAGRQGHPVGDHEGGIEADAELADQFRVVGGSLVLQGLHEGLGAGAGDGADVLLDLGLAHADAVVADGQGAGFLIGNQLDLPVAVAFQQGFVGVGLEADLVNGVGSVGDQLPQEDIAVGVQ